MFVVVKERVVIAKCIFMLFFGICLSFFGVFIRAILLFWSELFRASIFIMLLPFCFAALINQSINKSINQEINQSFYLPTSNVPTNLSIRYYLSSFTKSSFISRNSIIYQRLLSSNSDSNKGFIQTLLGFCRYVLS